LNEKINEKRKEKKRKENLVDFEFFDLQNIGTVNEVFWPSL
jgi:hypothetical protein